MKNSDIKVKWMGVLVVALVVLAVFLPVLKGEFLHWDDDALFVENPCYRGLDSLNWQWMCSTFLLGHWQPLSWLSCALDYTAWGMNPMGWHATNLLLHTANATLVYLLCLAFLKQQTRRYVAAILATLFWALHPLRVEAVAWLATRGYLLCTTFCLLTVLFYVVWRGHPCLRIRAGKDACPTMYLAALLCFTLATFTKGIGMMLPPVLLLMDWFPLRRITSVRTAAACVVEKIPFFALSLLTGITAFLAKKTNGGMAPIEKYGLVERFGQALYGIWFYLLKTVSPHNLSPLYDKRPEAGTVIVALVLTTMVVIFLFLCRRKLRPVTVSLGVFLLLIFPMIGFTQSGIQMFADRFTYLATIPFSVLLTAGLAKLRMMRRMVCGVLAVLLLFFCSQTFSFSIIWSDSLMLWRYLVEQDGDKAPAYNGMGQVLMSRKDYAKALECFDQALLLQPDYVAALQNRAIALFSVGKYKQAFTDASKALMLGNVDSGDRAKILFGRGQIAEKMSNSGQALADYSAVLADRTVDPVWQIMTLQSRAALYFEQGRRAEGKADLEAILELPDPFGESRSKAKRLLNELKKIPKE